MDETSIYLDFPSNYTFEQKGAKRVKASTTGAERARISVPFTASASRLKLPLFILIPRRFDLPNFVPPESCVVVYKTGATFNQEIICEYLRKKCIAIIW